MNIQVTNLISRNVLLATIKTSNIPTPRPPHMMKTSELLELLPEISSTEKARDPKTVTVKDAIIILHLQGKTGVQIRNELPTTHPAYIYTVISNYKRSLK